MGELKEFRIASSPAEAVALLRRGPGRGAYIAGGTDLPRGHPGYDFFVDISHAGIDSIDLHPEGDVFLGAATPVARAAADRRLAAFADAVLTEALAECARRVARTSATVGGQVCHRSRCGEVAPALLALDAECVIADEAATTTLPLSRFYRGEGGTALADRLLVGLLLPRTARLRRCLVHRHACEPDGAPLAQVAVGLDVVENRIVNLRIGLAGAVRVPQRALLAEAVLTGLDPRAVGPSEVRECAAAAAAEIAPLEDGYASAGYRRDLVAELIRRLVSRVLGWQDDDEHDRLA